MKSKLYTDVDYISINKDKELLCGDHIEILNKEDDKEKSTIVVLADGLGSGVKANILSTLTAKIISTMMANSLSVEDCVLTIAETLPTCKVREIAYSTFTIIKISENREAEIIQYDNPLVIFLRDGKNYDYQMITEIIDGKVIYKSKIILQENDIFIALSDGVVHAGIGHTLDVGWRREDIIGFLEKSYSDKLTAKSISNMIATVCNDLYDGKPSDDMSVCAIKIRARKQVNLMIGPPADPKDVNKMMSLFFSKEGKHIVCGGTTSALAAAFLDEEVKIAYVDSDLPPVLNIEGVDIVTEGVVTISKVLEYAKVYLEKSADTLVWLKNNDGASLISQVLFEESTDINFYVGRAVNLAHQKSDLPVDFNIKMRLIEELSDALKQMGKKIKVSYF